MTRQPWIARAVTFATLVFAPAIAAAQTSLATADAGDYLGVWTMELQGPQGAFEQELTLKDKNGKVSGEMVNAMAGTQVIDDVSKTGADLVMKYEGNYQGNAFAATITLTPDGANKVKVVFDVNGGMFTMNGSATKK